MRSRLLLKIFLSLALFVAIERFCHKQTAGFSLNKIGSTSSAPLIPQAVLDEDNVFFDQPYHFLGSGGQCYAFLSEDGNTVLKLFKNHHVRLWNWLSSFSLPGKLDSFRRQFLENNRHQSPAFFESCCIAFKDFRDRSGLIYLHLGKTAHIHKKLTLYDKIGVVHQIDLDQVDFALQKRVEMPREKLRTLIQKNDLDEAKACIDSIVGLILERCQKGIRDRDPNIRRNLGFIGTHAVEIDLGSFTKEESQKQPEVYLAELEQNTRKLKIWLERHCPELSCYLSKQIETIEREDTERHHKPGFSPYSGSTR